MTQASDSPRVRLYVKHPLGPGQPVVLERDQAHYLFNVMRLGPGDAVEVFNGTDGAWLARVAAADRRGGTLECVRQTAAQRAAPDLWLLFAPVKKARTDFIVEKATEMGAARIVPVQTRFTNSERVRQDRLQAHAVEAAEQCGATHIPELAPMVRLDRLLADWDGARRILWADETPEAPKAGFDGLTPGPWAVLIGPEGGFAETERDRLRALACVTPVGLGPRILRAETAAVAALTLWQIHLGDWT